MMRVEMDGRAGGHRARDLTAATRSRNRLEDNFDETRGADASRSGEVSLADVVLPDHRDEMVDVVGPGVTASSDDRGASAYPARCMIGVGGGVEWLPRHLLGISRVECSREGFVGIGVATEACAAGGSRGFGE